MKRVITLLCLFYYIIPGIAQSTFDYLYSSPLDEASRSLMEDEEGCIYFPVENFQYGLILKLNSEGHFLDSIRIDNPEGTCNLGELVPFNDDYFIALGTWSIDSVNALWFVKFNNELELIEDKKLDSEGHIVYDFKHIINNNGNIVFIALYNSPEIIHDICIYEITFEGELIRKVFFHKLSGFNQSFSIIENIFDHTYKVFTRTPLTNERLSSTFNIVDSNFNVLSYGSFEDAIYTHNTAKWIDDSTYIITGKMYYDSENEWDLGILKVSINDSISSSVYLGATDTVEWPSLFKSLDFISIDNLFYPGCYNTYWYPFQNDPSWIMLNIMDSDLILKSQHFYGGDAYYAVSTILATQDSGCVMACQRYDHMTQNNEFDVYILKVNKDGLLVSVPEDPIINYSVVELYPNPGKDILFIESKVDDLQIELFDVNGKLPLNLQLEFGTNVLHVSHIPGGIYLYRVFDKNKHLVQTGKWLKY